MAIAPLTINAGRQKVIDFSVPFMRTGISIMMKKPDKPKIDIFPFVKPLTKEVWACLVLSLFAVTAIFYIASRLSHRHSDGDYNSYRKRISICSSLLYSFSVLVYQVSNNFISTLSILLLCIPKTQTIFSLFAQVAGIFPRSVSNRIVSGVWWFFVFIVVTTYIANMTAYFVTDRIRLTIFGMLGNAEVPSEAYYYRKWTTICAIFNMNSTAIHSNYFLPWSFFALPFVV